MFKFLEKFLEAECDSSELRCPVTALVIFNVCVHELGRCNNPSGHIYPVSRVHVLWRSFKPSGHFYLHCLMYMYLEDPFNLLVISVFSVWSTCIWKIHQASWPFLLHYLKYMRLKDPLRFLAVLVFSIWSTCIWKIHWASWPFLSSLSKIHAFERSIKPSGHFFLHGLECVYLEDPLSLLAISAFGVWSTCIWKPH